MARVVLSTSFDMSTWDLSDLAGAAVVKDTGSKTALVSATAEYVYNGSGFVLDGSDQPTAGTVASLGMWEPAAAPHTNSLYILGLSADYVTFNGYVQAGDTTGLETWLFSGDDRFLGSTGDDVLLGYDGNDKFVLKQGGSDSASGGIGDDTFNMGAALDAGDRLDGGDGDDTLSLNGTTSVVLDALTIQNIEKITFHAGADYSLTLDAGNLSSGQTLTVNGGTLHSGDSLTLDGSAITDGNLILIGGAGDDVLTGGARATIFKLFGGGADTATGGAGNDKFAADDNFTAADVLTGGGGDDVLSLAGYASSGAGIAADPLTGVNSLTFQPGTLSDIDTIKLVIGFDYDLFLTNDAVAPGATLTIDGSKLCGCYITSFDGSAINDGGMLHIIGGTGDDFMAGGTGNDTFDGGAGNDMVSYAHAGAGVTVNLNLAGPQNTGSMGLDTFVRIESLEGSAFDDVLTGNKAANYFASGAGDDTLSGGNGDDLVSMGADLNSGDRIDGGGGLDALALSGDYSAGITITASMVTKVEQIVLNSGFSYDVTIGAGVVDSAGMQIGAIDPYAPDPGQSLTINASAVTGLIFLIGSDNADTLTGGSGLNEFIAAGGADTMTAGGSSAFFYGDASESTSTAYDTIIGFNADSDSFLPSGPVTDFDPNGATTTGTLSTATFDANLEAAIGATQMSAFGAASFTADTGDLAGELFIIIDENGTAGYQAGQDLVIHLQAPLNVADFGINNFG